MHTLTRAGVQQEIEMRSCAACKEGCSTPPTPPPPTPDACKVPVDAAPWRWPVAVTWVSGRASIPFPPRSSFPLARLHIPLDDSNSVYVVSSDYGVLVVASGVSRGVLRPPGNQQALAVTLGRICTFTRLTLLSLSARYRFPRMAR